MSALSLWRVLVCVWLVLPAYVAAGLPFETDATHPALVVETERALTQPVETAAHAYTVGADAVAVGAGSLYRGPTGVVLVKTGKAHTGAAFVFPVPTGLPPGQYRFWARWSAGLTEPQRFSVSAHRPDERRDRRAEDHLRQSTSWVASWRPGPTLWVLPGDRQLTVENQGVAGDAKIFDAFAFEMRTPLTLALNAAASDALSRALARADAQPPATESLYLLGQAPAVGALLQGLADHPADVAVQWLVGTPGEHARVDARWPPETVAVIGPRTGTARAWCDVQCDAGDLPGLVAADPHYGPPPPEPRTLPAYPTPLDGNGRPLAWLVSPIFGGRSGLSAQGLDAESRIGYLAGEGVPVPYLNLRAMAHWRAEQPAADGRVTLLQDDARDYSWLRGSVYADLWVFALQSTGVGLELGDTAKPQQVWLGGRPMPPLSDGLTYTLALRPGWQHLRIKYTGTSAAHATWRFDARFAGSSRPLPDHLRTALVPPRLGAAARVMANELGMRVTWRDATGGVLRQGVSLRAEVEFSAARESELPRLPLPARAELVLRDYDGKILGAVQRDVTVPGTVEWDTGMVPENGFFALDVLLRQIDGVELRHFGADGVSVVGGTERRTALAGSSRVAATFYFLASANQDGYFYHQVLPWLERMGIRRVVGSHPESAPDLWTAADAAGVTLCGDFSNASAAQRKTLAEESARHSDCFKSVNEVDLHHGAAGTPAYWTQRASSEHAAAHAARGDARYIGPSFATPGQSAWLREALRLGLYAALDRVDVHAYPQFAPRLGGQVGNSAMEADTGFRAQLAALGMASTKPYWLGETGALEYHGNDALRWQADTTAKIIAWVNSRSDYELAGFLTPWAYAPESAGYWPWAMGHRPGEAALYTATALVDGGTYRAAADVPTGMQAAWFGEVLMAWLDDAPDDRRVSWSPWLDPELDWVQVDVVGRRAPVPRATDGVVQLEIGSSPQYFLPAQVWSEHTR